MAWQQPTPASPATPLLPRHDAGPVTTSAGTAGFGPPFLRGDPNPVPNT
ncbi:hypothetical protein [Nonomuraea sp. NPDC023979]